MLGETAAERSQQWWWTAYEAAYLAVIRLKQENIVEAFFHSFRTFEGIFSKWSNEEFAKHILIERGRPILQVSILEDEKQYFADSKYNKNEPKNDLAKLEDKLRKDNGILLDLSSICKIFRAVRKEYKNECKNLQIFWKDGMKVTDRRNLIFHQLLGMTETQLWEFWEVSGQIEWENQILHFLNFITKQSFNSLGNVSLMAKIHLEIKEAIVTYQP